jgi:hypothetical protein
LRRLTSRSHHPGRGAFQSIGIGSRINAPATVLTLLEQWPAVQRQQAFGDVDATVGVDPDQVIIEHRVVDLREGDG